MESPNYVDLNIVRWEKKKAIKKAPGRIRTGDLRITNAALYQLSYRSLYQMSSDTYVIILKKDHNCKGKFEIICPRLFDRIRIE